MISMPCALPAHVGSSDSSRRRGLGHRATGKTLSLICGALTWLQDFRRAEARRIEQEEQQRQEQEQAAASGEAPPPDRLAPTNGWANHRPGADPSASRLDGSARGQLHRAELVLGRG